MKNTQRRRTSITVPPALFDEIQRLAKRDEQNFSQTLCQLARRGLTQQTQQTQSTH